MSKRPDACDERVPRMRLHLFFRQETDYSDPSNAPLYAHGKVIFEIGGTVEMETPQREIH